MDTSLEQLLAHWNTLSLPDRYMFLKLVQFADGRNIQFGRSTGTILGTATDQKIGFWGKTPVVQPAAIGQVSGGSTIDSQARAALNTLLTELHAAGIIG